MTILIEVSGFPAAQGSKRHVGGGRMIESSKAVGPWREAVRAETQRTRHAAHSSPVKGPVSVMVTFLLPRPKGHYGTGRNAGIIKASAPPYPAGRPDLDKLLRCVLDGLTAGGAFNDDSQVTQVAAVKRYGTPGCTIEIERLGE